MARKESSLECYPYQWDNNGNKSNASDLYQVGLLLSLEQVVCFSMLDIKPWKIDHAESFPHLGNAPIVEAVIHWRAEPSEEFDPDACSTFLKTKFQEYEIKPQHRFNTEITGDGVRSETCLSGFRLTSRDKKNVCQFLRKDVLFSRLKPYENWKQLLKEASFFWEAYQEFAKPVSVKQIGVRFISRIKLHRGEQISEVVNEQASLLNSLGLSPQTFFHRDELSIPDYPYKINLVRALENQDDLNRALIVDIDALTKDNLSIEENKIGSILEDLHYLKNKVFFEYVLEPEGRFGDR